MRYMIIGLVPNHKYYVCASGINFKAKSFKTRLDAEIAMREFCSRHNITLECVEFDKHERKYSNHSGIRFYINRI